MILPTLYKKTSTGAIQEWEIQVLAGGGSDGTMVGNIITVFGQKGGKKQTATEVITEGKNQGKANETTAVEQAEAEAKSRWEQKVKKGYVQNVEDATEEKVDTNFITGGVDPMLAHTYTKQGHKTKWPAYVQPKLYGHRCIAIYQNGVCTLWSRTRKRITGVPHIERAIEEMLQGSPNLILDGELYNHDYKDRFEELTSFIRQETPKPGHEVVQYWVYDVVLPDSFEKRNEVLNMLDELRSLTGPVVMVPTALADSEEDMVEAFGLFVAEGFEGLMVRNSSGPYKGKRSYDLQKVKTFDDAEFEVIAIEEGRGKMAGKAMFVCKVSPGSDDTFRVKMAGALDDLKDYFENPEPWIGKMLTVQFQGLSTYGVPRFPVGLRFRSDV